MILIFWRVTYRVLTSLGLFLGTLLHPFLWKWKYRDLLGKRLWPEPLSTQPIAWFHAVSLGEAVILNSVIKLFPEHQRNNFLLTSSTLTGLETLIKKNTESVCRYLPFDHPFSLNRMFKNVSVTDLVLVETEIWPELYRLVRNRNRKILIFNARLSRKSLKWSQNSLLRDAMKCVDKVLLRSEHERAGFSALGVNDDNMQVFGNIKFDYANPPLDPGPLKSWLEKSSGELFIFSSISDNEVECLAPQVWRLADAYPESRILWVPRHFDQLSLHLDALRQLEPVLRENGLAENSPARCVILNTIGELSGTYPYATLSVIGGSFNKRGGQNFLESLAAGVPALVGPSVHNFQMELDLALEKNAVIQVAQPDQLFDQMDRLLNDRDRMTQMKEMAKKLIHENVGATQRTVAELKQFLDV